MSDLWNFLANGDYDAKQAKRLAVFKKIEPAENWKNPIDAWVDEDDVDECKLAAIWFTGGDVEAVEAKDGKVRLVGGGYYANVGS